VIETSVLLVFKLLGALIDELLLKNTAIIMSVLPSDVTLRGQPEPMEGVVSGQEPKIKKTFERRVSGWSYESIRETVNKVAAATGKSEDFVKNNFDWTELKTEVVSYVLGKRFVKDLYGLVHSPPGYGVSLKADPSTPGYGLGWKAVPFSDLHFYPSLNINVHLFELKGYFGSWSLVEQYVNNNTITTKAKAYFYSNGMLFLASPNTCNVIRENPVIFTTDPGRGDKIVPYNPVLDSFQKGGSSNKFYIKDKWDELHLINNSYIRYFDRDNYIWLGKDLTWIINVARLTNFCIKQQPDLTTDKSIILDKLRRVGEISTLRRNENRVVNRKVFTSVDPFKDFSYEKLPKTRKK
jgi:hypothetical protein